MLYRALQLPFFSAWTALWLLVKHILTPQTSRRLRPVTGFALLFMGSMLLYEGVLFAQPLPEKLPWTLRNHYTFRTATGSILYCEEDAAWTLEDQEGTPVVEEVSFSIVLGDGQTIQPEDLERADAHRENFEHPYGAGTNYNVIFPPHAGLKIHHSFTSFKERGFQLITMRVENVSEESIAIRKISPVVFLPNAVHLQDTEAELHNQHVFVRGGSPLFNQNSNSMLSLFEESDREILLALGILPQGMASSGIDFTAYGGAWSGEVASHYEPAYALPPGETLVADAVWLSFGEGNRDNIDLNYAWFFSTLGPPPIKVETPPSWVTVPDTENVAALLSLAEAWQDYGIRHALIPDNWEQRPGSLEGATPHYPRKMAQAAKSFRDEGLIPGITIDPLATQEAEEGATASSQDGLHWLNLQTTVGQDLYAERIQTILGWGFDFIVIETSNVPDELLVEFGMTRSQADHLAFALAREIAGNSAVLPTASMLVKPESIDWANVGRVIKRMKEYAITPGPVQLQSESLGNVTEATLEAMQGWPGPVEIIGYPERQHRDIYEALFAGR